MAHGITQSDSMFSVREMPWHGLGVVLDEYPESIDEALVASGLKWPVSQRDVFVPIGAPALSEDGVALGEFNQLSGFKANIRDDTGDVLGIVSDEYTPVQNADAFAFLDSLIGSEMHFETAGSIHGGKRVWVLARLPEFVEVGGDATGTYVYVANSHDGSLAVTASVTPVRIVCANTLGAALRRANGADAQRTYRFRHTGSIHDRMYDAREVIGLTVNYTQRFKALGDELALERITPRRFERTVLDKLEEFTPNDEMGLRARNNRERNKAAVLDIFRGKGERGDTTGNAPGTKWAAFNSIGEWADWGRRYTARTNQMLRSFEDTDLKDRALELIAKA